MSNEKTSRMGRALGLAIAAMFVTAPTMGCSESHAMGPDAAAPQTDASAVADGASPSDAASPVDAAPEPEDAAVAMVDASFGDAGMWEEDDADLPDAYYPDGIRG